MSRFMHGLDDRFVMLRFFQLEKAGTPFAPILVGPAGLFVLNISGERGFFKVKQASWWKMDPSSHRYNPAKPNLIEQSRESAGKLAKILDAQGKFHPEVTPILILANAGANIETTNPAIRIVVMDGVESLISNLLYSEVKLQPNQINYLCDSIGMIANPQKANPVGEGEDFFGRDLHVIEKKPRPRKPSISISDKVSMPKIVETFKFSTKQWIILTVLSLIAIVALLIVIFYALSSA
jgi:hypothetical protein